MKKLIIALLVAAPMLASAATSKVEHKEGATCSKPGEAGRTSGGFVLTCKGGVWSK